MSVSPEVTRHVLVASDFDQTLSFNDSGHVLSELLGASDFAEKVAGLARSNLVQQGGELAYLIRHDPEFRCVRREHLVEAGRRVRLRERHSRARRLPRPRAWRAFQFSFFVISAAPREVIQSALEGIVPPTTSSAPSSITTRDTGEVRVDPRACPPATARSPCSRARAAARHRTRPDDLRRRRQLRRARHAARQQPRRFHHRGVREPAAGAHRADAPC